MKRILSFTPPAAECAVYTGEPAFVFLKDRMRERRIFLFTDENVRRIYDAPIRSLGCPVYVMPAGEVHKTPQTLFSLLGAMTEAGLRRNDALVALGGGVVGDLGGLAAALYMRGIGLWQVPTTLLAQVDSSVGGKTAVDFQGVKNLIGAFKQPELIVQDPAFLDTLPARELRCGLGEMVKHGGLDGEIFDALEANADRLTEVSALAALVPANLAYKAKIVEADPEEKGVRKLLNLGHTTAHAAELACGLSHGEAVLIGLFYEAEIARRHLQCDGNYLDRYEALVRRALQREIAEADVAGGLALALHDKKNRSGNEVVLAVPVERGRAELLSLPYATYREEILHIREKMS